MSLGEVVQFKGGSYDVRGIVDGRYIVRIRYKSSGVETYKIWTAEERETFNRNQSQLLDAQDRAYQIYERNLAGETFASLSREYGITPGRVSQICARQRRKELTRR